MTDQQARSLVQALPIPAFTVMRDARIAWVNTQAQTLLGAQIEGRHYVTALRQPDILDAIERSARDRTQIEAQFVITTETAETRFRVTAAPFGGDGEEGTLVSFEDITALYAAGLMRRDFVANVSHELRTPLTALIGFIETLSGPARDDTEARARFLGLMKKEAARMNRLVGDLLSLSRVEAVERQRPQDSVSIGAVLRASVASFAKQALDTGIRVEMTGDEQDILVRGDEDQLRQVINNLLENALKYGGEGGRVGLHIAQPMKDPTLRGLAVRIDITDAGMGIDPIHLPRLTERFYRIDEHRSREMGGTGLGLAIVKHIVHRHRGRMEIDSTPGEGSRFSVILPVL